MTRPGLYAVPDPIPDPPNLTPEALEVGTRTVDPSDVIKAFAVLGLDATNVRTIQSRDTGLWVEAATRIDGLACVATRASGDTLVHVHHLPWTQETT